MPITQSARKLATVYAAAMPRIVYNSTVSCALTPGKSIRFFWQVLSNWDLGEDDPVLGSAGVDELLPGGDGGDVLIQGPFYSSSVGGTCILQEIASLAYAVRALKARRVFEIGTFLGRMTRTFALNAPGAEIFTLDLPQGQVPHDKKLGRDFLDTPEAARITQLTGDSRTFDYAPFHGTADFVWVDACHDYEFVVNDTAAALKVCKPGGWIGWHDYRHTAHWSGVTRHVRDIRHRFKVIKHIRGTTTVLARFDG